MKAYTDIEQSKKLSEILQLESADMFYNEESDETYRKDIVDTKYSRVIREGQKHYLEEYGIPCWSLAALIKVLPSIEGFKPVIDLDINQLRYEGKYRDELCFNGNNLIDACYEMIIRLNELKML